MSADLDNLKKQREQYRHKAFKMMLEIGVIIALPALVGFFAGKYLTDNQTYKVLLLGVAFIFSWSIIIYKYNKFDKQVKKIDQDIKNLNSTEKEK